MRKLTSVEVDSVKVSKLLLEKQLVSSDCVLTVDEIFLQTSVQYHRGDFVGRDGERNFSKETAVLVIISLKKCISIATRALPKIEITGEWLKCEIKKHILDLVEVGFKVRVILDGHPSNVNVFTWLHEIFDGDNKNFIKHPAYADLATKTYLFFGVIHLFKNITNNLLNQKKFVFLSFQFDLVCDVIQAPEGYISWRMFNEVHERGENFLANLRKPPKITYQVTHVSTFAIFQESTTAATKSCFPNRLDAANFLTLFYQVFVLCNSKQRLNTSNQLGNAAIQGDHKSEIHLLVAE